MIKPTANHPLLFSFIGEVPSLKNNKSFVFDSETQKTLVLSSVDVEKFYNNNRPKLLSQWGVYKGKGYDTLNSGYKMGIYAVIYRYSRGKNSIPVSDTDNALTTLQEALQSSKSFGYGRFNKGIVPVVLDDRQYVSPHADVVVVPSKALAGAQVYVWCLDDRRSGQQLTDVQIYHDRHRKSLIINAKEKIDGFENLFGEENDDRT